MLIQPIDYVLVVWFTLAAGSTAYVAGDQCRNNPEPAVMKWGFILVTLIWTPSVSCFTSWRTKTRGRAREVSHAKAEALEAGGSLKFTSAIHIPVRGRCLNLDRIRA